MSRFTAESSSGRYCKQRNALVSGFPQQGLPAFYVGLILIRNPLITAVLNQHRARRIAQLLDMAIGGYRRLAFNVRENTRLRVLSQRRAIRVADVSPEVEAKARVALDGTAEVAVLAQIDFRVKNSSENRAVLEKVICRRRPLGAVGQDLARLAKERGVPGQI